MLSFDIRKSRAKKLLNRRRKKNYKELELDYQISSPKKNCQIERRNKPKFKKKDLWAQSPKTFRSDM